MCSESEKNIFLQALDEENPAERQAYLDSACGDNAALRGAVEALLAAHHRPANLLDKALGPGGSSASKALDSTLGVESVRPSEHIGTTIGSYRLMELIGEGGFGLVFVAQQGEPVKRKVALKIVKPGTGSKEVLARFDAERQAVAMMDHPNIAQVFDAGITDDARPYFVMELVQGVPITEFCDQHKLSLRQRVELFEDVCAATHHAHQKGVIHRDLKPSNVLVALHDARPVAKVIDFGVAKAVGQQLTNRTIYTRFYSMIGTPLYMSPEQAAMGGLDVDTRSDIYSLGVLLYELLTGTTPFDRARFDSAGYDEMRRIIREEEPPKPSTRLTTIRTADPQTVRDAPSMQQAAAQHGLLREKRESIPSDLDWIVMKAMDKDRRRRYESAAAMSDDLRRFLSQQPIEARPPSRRYRLTKFARRNRVALATGTLVAMALVVGTAASLYQASRAITERNDKEAALRAAIRAESAATKARRDVENFTEQLKTANSLVGNARTYEDSERFAAADAAYSEAVELVPNYYLVWVQRAQLRAKLFLWEEAAEDFSAALTLKAPLNSGEWQGAAPLFVLTGRTDDYRAMYARLMNPSQEDASTLTWSSIRACLIAPLDQADAERMATRVESLLVESNRPPDRELGMPGQPPRFRPPGSTADGFGGRAGDRFAGGPLERERNGGPGPPEFAPPRRGPGGPSFEDRVPWGVQQYVAAWACLRTGNPEEALQHLDLASQDRGWPNIGMIHSLTAIAHHQAGRTNEALASLGRSDEAMDRMMQELDSAPNVSRPWFDFVEAVLLHREATAVITETTPELDPRIAEVQEQSRALLRVE